MKRHVEDLGALYRSGPHYKTIYNTIKHNII